MHGLILGWLNVTAAIPATVGWVSVDLLSMLVAAE